jgi:hypothetical protein
MRAHPERARAWPQVQPALPAAGVQYDGVLAWKDSPSEARLLATLALTTAAKAAQAAEEQAAAAAARRQDEQQRLRQQK